MFSWKKAGEVDAVNCDVAVIGGGPAGLAAAVEAKKHGAQSVIILERDRELGGILNQCIHNGFGLHEFQEELTGPEYAQRFIHQVQEQEIELMLNTMVLHIDKERHIRAVGSKGLLDIQAGAIVLAMGCRERTAGAIALKGYRPAGVYTAGMAQRILNMEGYQLGKRVVIYGSGDIGLIMARRMTLEGAKVEAVVEIMPYSSGLNRNIAQCLEDYDIPLLLNHSICSVHGKEKITAVTVAELDGNGRVIEESRRDIPCDTLLLSVGLIPENELSEQADIPMDIFTGGAVADSRMQTEAEGIFACGNVLHVHDIVDFVTKESRIAGRNAAFFARGVHQDKNYVTARAQQGIRYVMPHKIRTESPEGVDLYMRVDGIYKNAKIIVRSGEEILMEKKMRHLIPSEMIHLTMEYERICGLTQELTVEVEGEHYVKERG